VLSLDPRLEGQISDNLRPSDGTSAALLEPRLADLLIRRLIPLAESMVRQKLSPVLLCGPDIRRHLKTFTRRSIPRLAVLSANEIPMAIDLSSFAVVKAE
jgi:flagellar biosynthesis protein FlhA